MLAQLMNAGVLKRLGGLVFGKFTDCFPSDSGDPHLTIEQVQKEYASTMKCPVIANFQYGHVPKKLTIPIGVEAGLNTGREKITIQDSAVV
jgi:muramoyltetrapeptide carboxypeptidase